MQCKSQARHDFVEFERPRNLHASVCRRDFMWGGEVRMNKQQPLTVYRSSFPYPGKATSLLLAKAIS